MAREESEGIKTEQRPVGVRRHDIDGVDDTGVVERPKDDDAEQEGQAHGQMDAAADFTLAFSVVHTIFQVQEVDADTRGERSDGRIGTGKCCRHDADAEGNDKEKSQCARRNEHGKQGVAR